EWDAFARTQLPAARIMSDKELRDHAKQILQAAAEDIDTAQSTEQQSEKSRGLGPPEGDEDSAASVHGSLRQLSGFSMSQLIAEYRALRATVLRLWFKQVSEVTDATSNDMIRFNESIDQALAESSDTFTNNAFRTRDTFLAILGHDLRSPLSTMAMSGEVLTKPDVGSEQTQEVGARIKRSAAMMSSMVVDLMEYSRTQLGAEIPINRQPADIAEICRAAGHDSGAAYPDCAIEVETSGDMTGCFDSVRLQQLFTNLLNNAAQYRSKDQPVVVCARGEPHEIVVQVKNQGPVIPADALRAIFDPLVRLARESHHDARPSTSLGLGLFVAREVTEAHGGTIIAQSSVGAGTVFTVCLPRREPQKSPEN
ncbi:sensor histidine kinase, partial [Lysobacter sp. A3-1-A15]